MVGAMYWLVQYLTLVQVWKYNSRGKVYILLKFYVKFFFCDLKQFYYHLRHLFLF